MIRTNNATIESSNTEIRGNNNTITEDDNNIRGNNLKVVGNGNVVRGNNITIIGRYNVGIGNNIDFHGPSNRGKGNNLTFHKTSAKPKSEKDNPKNKKSSDDFDTKRLKILAGISENEKPKKEVDSIMENIADKVFESTKVKDQSETPTWTEDELVPTLEQLEKERKEKSIKKLFKK